MRDLGTIFPIISDDDSIDTSDLEIINEMEAEIVDVKKRTFFPTQVNTARDIIRRFSKTQLVMLLAQMQSGKTGTFLCTACAMVHYGIVQRVIVFTGVPESALYEQLVRSVTKATKRFDEIMHSNVTGKITPLKACQLTTTTIEPNTLVVWDESHYAQDTKNRPFKMFQNNGLLVDGTTRTNDQWKQKDSFLLTVSATPFSEFVDCRDSAIYNEITKEIVAMQPGPSYHGVSYFHERNLILPSWDIMKPTGQRKFVQLLRNAKTIGTPKYGLLRSRANSGDIRILAQHAGWNKLIFYDMKNKSTMPEGWKTLENAPTEDTLVVLKNMGRLGQVVPKEHIAFVFESTTGMGATDTILQSLLGRMCGYYDDEPYIHVYVSKRLTDEKTLDDPEGSEISLQSRIMLKNQIMDKELHDFKTANAHDDFAIAVYSAAHQERLQREVASIRHDHAECIDYITSSEIQRYVSLMTRKYDDVPRYAKNIIRSRIRQTNVGIVGYSTVPEQISIDLSSTEWTPIEECASVMSGPTGCRGVTDALKIRVVEQMIDFLTTKEDAFGDNVQRIEIITLLKSIQDGKLSPSQIINFGDLNSSKAQKKRLRVRMQEAIHNKMPYIDAVNEKMWRTREAQGIAKRIQIMICSPVDDPSSPGVPDFNTTSTLYFTGYTYEANQYTKESHKRQNIPTTTRHEAFHHTHELCFDTVATWINVIKDEDAFMGLVDTEFPSGKRIRVLPTMSVPTTVIAHLDAMCLHNNGLYKVQRITGRRTREDKAMAARVERYEVFFFQRSKLSIAV